MKDTTEYIDVEALTIWQNKLKEINEECLEILDDFYKKSLELKSVWSGKVASTFDANFFEKINETRIKHNELTDLNAFLLKIANTFKEE